MVPGEPKASYEVIAARVNCRAHTRGPGLSCPRVPTLRPAGRPSAPQRPPEASRAAKLAQNVVLCGLCAYLLAPALARATPGQATRLGGPEAQGPATRALTALHHNPAMLAGMRGLRFQIGGAGGLDQRWIERAPVTEDGAPTSDALDRRISLLNPSGGYFVGGSLYFEPVAVGIGAYDLGSELHYTSDDRLRWHLAPEPDRMPIFCRRDDTAACRLNGGAATARTDITVAVAWNVLGNLRIGAGVHFPRLRQRFAFDHSTVIAEHRAEGPRCNQVEDPQCAERIGFNGRTRWLPDRDNRPSGFDVALSFGLAVDIGDRVTLGLRYRTRPLVNGGALTLAGSAVVCRPDSSGIASDVLPCSVATPIDATLTERLSREAALGVSVILGRSRLWHLDSNLYWIDLCNDRVGQGAGVRTCADPGGQQLSLVGLDRNSVLLPESARYRGRQDVFGFDAYTTYRARSNLAVVLGNHFASPATRRQARSAADGDGWRLGFTVGVPLRVRQSNLQVVPGYGLDVYLPTRVLARDAAFDPIAASTFAASGGDINGPTADLVLAGRGRTSNAGRYTGAAHTVMLTLRWSERMLGFE